MVVISPLRLPRSFLISLLGIAILIPVMGCQTIPSSGHISSIVIDPSSPRWSAYLEEQSYIHKFRAQGQASVLIKAPLTNYLQAFSFLWEGTSTDSYLTLSYNGKELAIIAITPDSAYLISQDEAIDSQELQRLLDTLPIVQMQKWIFALPSSNLDYVAWLDAKNFPSAIKQGDNAVSYDQFIRVYPPEDSTARLWLLPKKIKIQRKDDKISLFVSSWEVAE